MNFERYDQLMLCEQDKDVVLKTGKCFSIDFEIEDEKAADRIFMTGEVEMFYNWKTEPDYALLYRRIDDSLSSIESERSQYALDMSADNFDYLKIAYKKVVWWPRYYGGGSDWRVGLSVKAENLKIHEGGYLHFLVELRYSKPGVDKRMAYSPADVVTVIDIPEGSYPYQVLEEHFKSVGFEKASVCIYLEGKNYSGNVFCEAPYLVSEASANLISDFNISNDSKPEFNWFGVNLSKKETPSFIVELNGEVIHNGEIFERCHRYSEWDFSIPEGVAKKGKNTLKITHTSSYRDAPPYNLHELGLVSVRRDMLIWCPEMVTVGEQFPVLLKTDGAVSFTLADAPDFISATAPLKCDSAGFAVLNFICREPKNNVSFKLIHDGGEIECNISRAVIRADDDVITGTGDLVYVNQNYRDFENYLAWYLSNDVGRLLTIRPTYRWSGSKSANCQLWRDTADLLDKLGIKYSHMRDGREMQGVNANPTYDELASKNFLGRQTHELDGAYNYWGQRDITANINEQWFMDLNVRTYQKDGERMNSRYNEDSYFYRDGKVYVYRDPTVPRDMEAIANAAVDGLKKTRGGSTRHTGPATIFKYFYQAGYSWTGAELMYSSTEVTCAALRGAAKAYGGNIGGHLATQWSTTPHDVPEHSKRYRLALYTSYMQGINEINTEEGLWRMEEYFAYHNRFSKACLDHMKEHKAFNRYVTTHARSGSFYTPIAFLNGRFDGWKTFGAKNTLWGRSDMQYGDPENGWDMLNVFYPHSAHGALYRHSCPRNKPVGYYSGTPMGNVDVLAIEAQDYSDYPLLCCVTYNKALDEDMTKFSSYVENGGKLFIGLAQFSTTTKRDDIETYSLSYIDHPFADKVIGDINFVADSINGNSICVNSNIPDDANVLKITDNGRALIYELSVGCGKVIILNTREYAGAPALYEIVRGFVSEISEEQFANERAWAKGDDAVQFTAYKQENGDMHFYFLSTDWYDADEPSHAVYLRIGSQNYEFNIAYGTMIKAVVSGEIGAWFDCEDCDVLGIADGKIKVQGIGEGKLFVAKDGQIIEKIVDFATDSVMYLEV